eukprot:Clim_evm17s84 gene=Clim_evmTU17s84
MDSKRDYAAFSAANDINTGDDAAEIEVTSSVLLGAARFIQPECRKIGDAFILCKAKKQDPQKCLEEGKAVTQCALGVFKKIKQNCNEEFTKHWKCLDANNQSFQYCRTLEAEADKCMLDKVGIKAELSE